MGGLIGFEKIGLVLLSVVTVAAAVVAAAVVVVVDGGSGGGGGVESAMLRCWRGKFLGII